MLEKTSYHIAPKAEFSFDPKWFEGATMKLQLT